MREVWTDREIGDSQRAKEWRRFVVVLIGGHTTYSLTHLVPFLPLSLHDKGFTSVNPASEASHMVMIDR